MSVIIRKNFAKGRKRVTLSHHSHDSIIASATKAKDREDFSSGHKLMIIVTSHLVMCEV